MAAIAGRTYSSGRTVSQARMESAGRTLARVGFWSAVLTAFFYSAWLLGALTMLFLPPTWSFVAMSAPSLFIPLTWVVLALAVRRCSPEDKQIYGDIAAAFAVMYGALLTMNYFVALTVTVPKDLAGQDAGILALGPQSLFLAVEVVGYTLMSLSALFLAFTITGSGLRRWIRWTLLAAGFFGMLLPFQMFLTSWPSPITIAAMPREFAFVAAPILLAIMFHREERVVRSLGTAPRAGTAE